MHAEGVNDALHITVIKENSTYKGAEAVGMFDAECEEVWSVLTDYAGSSEFMPHMRESGIVERNGNTVFVRNVFKVVLFNVEVIFEMNEDPLSRRISWKQHKGPFSVNTGQWILEDCGSGTTKATYHTELDHPLLPAWVKKSLINDSIPELYKAVRKRLLCKQTLKSSNIVDKTGHLSIGEK